MRVSSGVARTCSGDMYETVPTVVPASVSSASVVRVACSAPIAAGAGGVLASPKSRIFGPRAVRKMFAGLMSRCTMPLLCAASRASATAQRDVNEGRDLQRAASEPLLERLAFEQLHRDERRIGADIVDGADIGMVER